ncbi:enoyl-CoA hydratase-related protein [Metallumcola ferriviriculae]|uniref:short-chain-enoyl-CoA hydratase n=1 Tax=Metallumcola ferriviriculae TaxID=3039180 RepID=A0AAU0URP8_9FIRM|nr:enoyl-CoA hydratase-related protein [Desulfitibacteraceae bacterium MK1]
MTEKMATVTIAEQVATITINHPPVNALSNQVLQDLDEAVAQVESNNDVWVVVITGAGDKAFVAGADIRQFPNLNAADGEKMAAFGQQVFSRIEGLNKPVLAAIDGFALGGGCELAMACDIRIASAKSKLGQPEVNLGVLPGFGGTQRLSRLVGLGKAKELIYTADMVDAYEAQRIGLVEKVVEEGSVLDAAYAMAKKIIAKGPLAVATSKQAIDKGWDLPIEQGLALEAKLFGELCESEDQKEGAKAFLEKRPADFKRK